MFSIEANTKNAGGNKIRLTCSAMMSLRLINAWTATSEIAHQKHDMALLADIAFAVAAAFKAIDEAHVRAGLAAANGIGKMSGGR